MTLEMCNIGSHLDCLKENAELRHKLKVAAKALKELDDFYESPIARQALKEIDNDPD